VRLRLLVQLLRLVLRPLPLLLRLLLRLLTQSCRCGFRGCRALVHTSVLLADH
jgi:hypothetical protein